jgi:hypothetical protein
LLIMDSARKDITLFWKSRHLEILRCEVQLISGPVVV